MYVRPPTKKTVRGRSRESCKVATEPIHSSLHHCHSCPALKQISIPYYYV